MITPPSPPARLLVAYSEKQVKSPIDPTRRSPTVVSTACAASSTIASPCSRAIAWIASMSQGAAGEVDRQHRPRTRRRRRRQRAGSRLSVQESMSANTGVAPVWTIALVVAGQVNEVVTTSSPSPTPAASSAR